MRVAVTYDDGKVFQHFGRTEKFRLFDIEEDEIIASEIFSSNGVGHEALAGLLEEHDIDALICGGLGQGAKDALTEAGIEVVSGAEGDIDEVIKKYIAGELESSGVNCDHHNHEHEEGHGCGGCGGHCGSGCSGCGGSAAPQIEGPNVGKKCHVHYEGTFNDGKIFDSSYERGQTLDFICGIGMMIRGFDEAVATMNVGETVNVHLMPDEAYGYSDPNAIITMSQDTLEGTEELNVGDDVYLYDQMGQPHRVKVVAKTDDTITFDTNHEMAGKELNFKIELVSIEDI